MSRRNGARTESYAVIISAALAGTAAGNLAAGLLAGASVRQAFIAAAGTALTAAAWAVSRKNTLRPAPAEHQRPRSPGT